MGEADRKRRGSEVRGDRAGGPGRGRGVQTELDPDGSRRSSPQLVILNEEGEREVAYEGLVGLLIEAPELGTEEGRLPAGAPRPPIESRIARWPAAAAESLPSYSLPAERVAEIALPPSWPVRGHPEWAWGGSTGEGRARLRHRQRGRGRAPAGRRGRARGRGRGRRGGLRRGSPTTTRATSSATARPAPGSSARSRPTASCPACGCSGRQPRQRRLMLAGLTGRSSEGYDVINMSLSTTKPELSTLCTSSPTAPTSSARRSSPPPTTWPSRATRGGSPR